MDIILNYLDSIIWPECTQHSAGDEKWGVRHITGRISFRITTIIVLTNLMLILLVILC